MFFEKVFCRSTGQCLSCYSYNIKNQLVYKLMVSEITCSLKQIKQYRQITALCCVGTVEVGWGWQLIRGVNINNASPEYLQPERVISDSCNYPPGYLPSDPTSGQSIVLGSPSILEGLAFHFLPWFPVNCQLSIPPSYFHHLCKPETV